MAYHLFETASVNSSSSPRSMSSLYVQVFRAVVAFEAATYKVFSRDRNREVSIYWNIECDAKDQYSLTL
jgi:hypothetical protein